MKKIKNLVKKGGVADIITLMVIVGLVIALIIAVVLPMVRSTENAGDTREEEFEAISSFTDTLGNASDVEDLELELD